MTTDRRLYKPLRDSQRAKLYRAERDVVPRGQTFISVADMQAYVDRLVQSAWFAGRWRYCHQGAHGHPFLVTDGRGRRRACCTGRTIKMPLWARSELFLLHELAHGINCWEHCDVRTHGWRFASILLDLVRHCMGKDTAAALRESFRRHRVRYTKLRASRAAHPNSLAALARINAARKAVAG